MKKMLFFFLCTIISFCYAAERNDLPLYVSSCSYTNKRNAQEDRKICVPIYGGFLFMVCDGHSGDVVADYMAKNLSEKFEKYLSFSLTKKQVFENAFFECEEYALNQSRGGSTAVAVYIKNRKAYIGNIGDSRCVFGSSDKVLLATHDHRPDREDECDRILQADGIIYKYTDTRDIDNKIPAPWRINGLAMSRVIGDGFAKGKKEGVARSLIKQKAILDGDSIVPVLLEQWGKGFQENSLECEPKVGQVIADVEYVKQKITDEYRWLILATDGLWDVISNEEAIQIVQSYHDKWCGKKEDKSFAGFDFKISFSNKLAQKAIKKGSEDNITVIVVDLLELCKNS